MKVVRDTTSIALMAASVGACLWGTVLIQSGAEFAGLHRFAVAFLAAVLSLRLANGEAAP